MRPAGRSCSSGYQYSTNAPHAGFSVSNGPIKIITNILPCNPTQAISSSRDLVVGHTVHRPFRCTIVRGLSSVKVKIFAATGIAATMLAASGVALAATTAARHTTAKACVNSTGSLRLTQSNGRCPRGTKSFTALAKGGPGTALGYAHIKPGGLFDASRSYNVAASNVKIPRDGFYCFSGLKFTPHNVQVTLDYNGVLNGQIPGYSVQLPTDHTTCPGGGQVMVFTGLVNPGVITAGKKLGFFVVFH